MKHHKKFSLHWLGFPTVFLVISADHQKGSPGATSNCSDSSMFVTAKCRTDTGVSGDSSRVSGLRFQFKRRIFSPRPPDDVTVLGLYEKKKKKKSTLALQKQCLVPIQCAISCSYCQLNPKCTAQNVNVLDNWRNGYVEVATLESLMGSAAFSHGSGQ